MFSSCTSKSTVVAPNVPIFMTSKIEGSLFFDALEN